MARRRREPDQTYFTNGVDTPASFDGLRAIIQDEVLGYTPSNLGVSGINSAYEAMQRQFNESIMNAQIGYVDPVEFRQEYPSIVIGGSNNLMATAMTATTQVLNQQALPQEAPRPRGRLVAVYSVADLAWSLHWLRHIGKDINPSDIERVLYVYGRGNDAWSGGFVLKMRNGKLIHVCSSMGNNDWASGDSVTRFEEGQHLLDFNIPSNVNLKENPEELNRWVSNPDRDPIAE